MVDNVNDPFDMDAFMNAAEETAALDTEYRPVPQGKYLAVVEKVEGRRTTYTDKKTGEEKVATNLDVTWDIQDDQVKLDLQREKVTVRQGLFLELNPQGKIDTSPGKNVRLGRLRAALGQNTPGPWSPMSMQGCGPCYITVTHREDKRPGKEAIFAEVGTVEPVNA